MDLSDDIELQELLRKLGVALVFIIIFGILFALILVNIFLPKDSKVLSKVEKKETFYVLIDDNKCTRCKKIKEILKEQEIEYIEINIDKSNYYKRFLRSISSSENDVVIPSMMFIYKGELESTIVDIKDEEILNSFIDRTKEIIG